MSMRWKMSIIGVLFGLLLSSASAHAANWKSGEAVLVLMDGTTVVIKGVDPATLQKIDTLHQVFLGDLDAHDTLNSRVLGKMAKPIDMANSVAMGKVILALNLLSGKLSNFPSVDVFQIAAVQPNYLNQANFAPNDPMYPDQPNFGVVRWGEAVDYLQANGVTPGQGVVFAVIDTGVSCSVEDLSDGQFLPGYNGITGIPDDPSKPCATWGSQDDRYHGTHVAGTMMQATNNGVGVAGVAYGARMMSLKFLDAKGSGSDVDALKAVRWAIEEKGYRNVIANGSYGGGDSSVKRQTVQMMKDANWLFVVSAGNNNTGSPNYPASYTDVLSVCATDNNGGKASFSAYGMNAKICAPGVNIKQNTIITNKPNTNDYRYLNGTSMSAPHVSGVAGLVKTLFPNWTAEQIKERLLASAVDLGDPGPHPVYGEGFKMVDAYAALTYVQQSQPPTISFITPVSGSVSGTVSIKVRCTDDVRVSNVRISVGGFDLTVSSTPPEYSASWDTSSLLDMTYKVMSTCTDNHGQSSAAVANLTTVNGNALPPPPPSDNLPPKVSYVTPPKYVTVKVGGAVTFTAKATDPDGDTLKLEWKVGDSEFFTASNSISHVFNTEARRILVMLKVSDGEYIKYLKWYVKVVR